MQTQTTVINAKKAREFLELNVPFEQGGLDLNRPLSRALINNYAKEMLRGNWRLTHQGIAFSVNGKLKDGQHRLLAIVQASEEGAFDGDEIIPPQPKIAIKMQVTWGLDDDIFPVLDIGKNRTSATVLAMAGYSNQLKLAAVGRLVYLFDNYEYKYWRKTGITNGQVLDTVRSNRLEEYMPTVSKLTPIGFIGSAAAAGYFVCERALPGGEHENFIEALELGAGLASDSPVLILRNYLGRSRNAKNIRRDAYLHLALYIKTWNDFCLGRRRSSISWRNTEIFPKPLEAAELEVSE